MAVTLAAGAFATAVFSDAGEEKGTFGAVGILMGAVGISVSFFAAMGVVRRISMILAIASAIVDTAVISYWLYVLIDAIQNSR